MIDYAARLHCDLMKVGGEFNPRPNTLAFGTGVDQAVIEGLNKAIVKLRDSGWVKEMRDKWVYEKTPEKVCEEHRKMSNGISLRNIGGVFLVIAVGIILTVIALYTENWYYERKRVWDARKARLAAIQSVPKQRTKRRCTLL